MGIGVEAGNSTHDNPPPPKFIAPYPVSMELGANGALQPDGSGSNYNGMSADPTLFGALGSVADDDAELMRMMHNRAVGQAVQELGLSQEAAALRRRQALFALQTRAAHAIKFARSRGR